MGDRQTANLEAYRFRSSITRVFVDKRVFLLASTYYSRNILGFAAGVRFGFASPLY